MKIINSIAILLISAGLGFLSMAFFIGTQEQHLALMKELPTSFFIRFASFSLIGLILVALLTLVNWTLNKVQERALKLNKIFLFGLLSVILSSLIGSLLFYFH